MNYRQHKKNQWMLSALLIAAVALAGLFIGGAVGYKAGLKRAFASPLVARFQSAAKRDTEIWLFEEGFRQKGLSLCVLSPATREQPVRVAMLDLKDAYSFAFAQWTRDGQMVIIGLNVGDRYDMPVAAIAYDFEKNAPFMPAAIAEGKKPELSRTAWQEHEQKIMAMVAAHGGLVDTRIDRDAYLAEADVYTAGKIPN